MNRKSCFSIISPSKVTSVFLSMSVIILSSLCSACTGEHHEHDEHDETFSEEHNHEGAFELDSHIAEKFGLSYETVTPAPFSEVIKTSGVIETAPSDLITLTARKSGIFTLSSGINVGSSVNGGVSIGIISPDAVQGGDAAKASKANLELAKKEYERLKPLYEEGLVTATTLNEAERNFREAEALYSPTVTAGRISVTAPESGTLTSLLVTSGQYVEAGTPIATITKNTRLSLRADIPSRYSALIPGIVTANFRPENSDSVIILAEHGGVKISGSTAPTVTSGYIPVYFSFSGNPATIAGGYSEVFLIGQSRPDIISVPLSSLIEMQGKYYLYVVHDGHAYEKRLVETGVTDGKRIEIKSGLAMGEEIVAKGASVVRMAETSAIAPPSHSHNH